VPGLAELAYTTAGGVVGAAASSWFGRQHERRLLRAEVMGRVQAMAVITAGVRDVAIGWAPLRRTAAGRARLTGELGVRAVLDGGADAEQALREAFAELSVAALAAGVPRRIMDFAGGAHERALECAVIALADRRLGGVLPDAAGLMAAADAYQRGAVGLLIRTLWHPWRTRLTARARLRALRAEVAALEARQERARAVLADPEYADRLHRELDAR